MPPESNGGGEVAGWRRKSRAPESCWPYCKRNAAMYRMDIAPRKKCAVGLYDEAAIFRRVSRGRGAAPRKPTPREVFELARLRKRSRQSRGRLAEHPCRATA